MSLKTSFNRAGTTRSEPPGTTGSETGTTPVPRTTWFQHGSTDRSYPLLNVEGEKETTLSLLPRIWCRSFKLLHHAGLKKQKPRAGVAAFFTKKKVGAF